MELYAILRKDMTFTECQKLVHTFKIRGDNMADYKQMYLTLLDATEKAINELVSAQRACEDIYINSVSEEETAEKAKFIKIKEK